MWRLYLEVGTLVVIAFAVGAVLATVVVGRLVERSAPGDDVLPTSASPGGGATTAPHPGSKTPT